MEINNCVNSAFLLFFFVFCVSQLLKLNFIFLNSISELFFTMFDFPSTRNCITSSRTYKFPNIASIFTVACDPRECNRDKNAESYFCTHTWHSPYFSERGKEGGPYFSEWHFSNARNARNTLSMSLSLSLSLAPKSYEKKKNIWSVCSAPGILFTRASHARRERRKSFGKWKGREALTKRNQRNPRSLFSLRREERSSDRGRATVSRRAGRESGQREFPKSTIDRVPRRPIFFPR